MLNDSFSFPQLIAAQKQEKTSEETVGGDGLYNGKNFGFYNHIPAETLTMS